MRRVMDHPANERGGLVVTAAHSVLVVDDDDDVRFLVAATLRGAGHDVSEASSGAAAIESVRAQSPDLVTLDLGLPDMDGTSVCRAIRQFSDAYIIMVTGRTDEMDRLLGLDLGADDYINKPFSPQELRARSAALLRRPRTPRHAGDPTGTAGRSAAAVPPADAQPEVIDAGHGLVVVPDRGLALLNSVPLPLTPVEVQILAVLAREPGRRWDRRDLVKAVWTDDFGESHFLLDVHIGNVRRKLRKLGGRREWIRSVEGVAYQLGVD